MFINVNKGLKGRVGRLSYTHKKDVNVLFCIQLFDDFNCSGVLDVFLGFLVHYLGVLVFPLIINYCSFT